MRLIPVALVMSLILLPTACANPGTAASDVSADQAPIIGSSPGPLIASEPFLDLIALQAEHARDVHDAGEFATAQCMKTRGFTYTPTAYRARVIQTVHIGDLEYAKRDGFGLVYSEEGTEAPQTRPELAGLSAGQAEAWVLAYSGRPVGPLDVRNGVPADDSIIAIDVGDGSKMFFRRDSCLAQGQQAVVGDVRDWRSVEASIQAMRNEVSVRTEGDPTWLVAQGSWVECMKSDGFGALSREEHKEALLTMATTGRKSLAAVKAEEISVAVASATCEVSLNIGIAYVEAQSRIERQVAEANQATIIRFKELQKQAAEKAAQRLADR